MARFALCVFLSSLFMLAIARKSYKGYSVIRMFPNNSEQVEWVRNLHMDENLDLWSLSDVMVGPDRQKSFIDQLNKMNITWETLIPDVQITIDAESIRQQEYTQNVTDRGISFTKYNRYFEIVAYLKQLATDYPDVVTVNSIGTTTEGRDLQIIKISTGGNGNRPIILIDAGIHAREWISPAMALYIIQELVENPTNADLIANVDWHIVPLLNPDGYAYSHEEVRMWRKTRSTHVCLGRLDPKQGVDGNRNFDFHWMEKNASSSPCSQIFAGPSAFSEPEIVALRDYVLAIAAHTKLYISFHSYGNYILYPWGYTSDLPCDWKVLDDLAHAANAAQEAAGGSSYQIGTAPNLLYAAGGSSHDWMKGVGGIDISYIVELPGGGKMGFDLPASDIASTVSTFFPAVRSMGEYVYKRSQ